MIAIAFSLPRASRGKQECSRSVQEASGAARGAQEKRTIERQGSRLGTRGSRLEGRGSRVEAAGPRLGVLPEELLEVQGGVRGAGGKPELQKGRRRSLGESRRGG